MGAEGWGGCRVGKLQGGGPKGGGPKGGGPKGGGPKGGGPKGGGPKGGGPKGGGPKFRAFFPLPTRGWSLRVCIIEKVVTTQIWSSLDIL